MQISTRLRRRMGIAATVLAVSTAAVTTAGTGDADAGPVRTYPLSGCIGLSPNIIDRPYMPTQLIVDQSEGYTYLTVYFNSMWLLVGYDSTARLDWHNLSTNKKGSQFSGGSKMVWGLDGTHSFAFRTRTIGTGRVKITLNSVNRNALWAIPALSCSAYIRVR